MLFDKRRTRNDVSRAQRVARKGRRGDGLSGFAEVRAPGTALGGRRGLAAAAPDPLERRLLQHAAHRGAQAHDLRSFLRRMRAVAAQVLLVELALERPGIAA